MIEMLEKLFGSASRVKIMRLFLFNPVEIYDLSEVVARAKVGAGSARHEIALLEKIGLVRKRSFFKDAVSGKKKIPERKRASGWILDETFEYLEPLQTLLTHVSPTRNKQILHRLSRAGKLKLVILSGFFIQNWDARVDLFIVGDNLRKGALENIVRLIESEAGREVRYASFETADFKYRLGVYDKLVRDVLDFKHEIILDKLSLPDVK